MKRARCENHPQGDEIYLLKISEQLYNSSSEKWIIWDVFMAKYNVNN